MHSVECSPPDENTPIANQSIGTAVPGASNQSKTNIRSGSRKTVPNTRLCQALSAHGALAERNLCLRTARLLRPRIFRGESGGRD